MADYDLLDPAAAEADLPDAGKRYIDLTAELGCTELRARRWYLDPGEATNFHRQGVQEELYVLLSGPGRMRLEDDYLDVPEGACVRVSPETRRQVLNDTEGTHVWLIVGAPPVEGDGQPIAET